MFRPQIKDRLARAGVCLLALTAPAVPLGCLEQGDDINRPLIITGTVTYHGSPVKQGTIHFLPVVTGNLPATGAIANGEITDVTTRKHGDGIKKGKYRLAIVPFDDDFLESAAKRNVGGVDPDEVIRAAADLNKRKLLPARYSNSRESGLTAEISPGNREIHLDLVD